MLQYILTKQSKPASSFRSPLGNGLLPGFLFYIFNQSEAKTTAMQLRTELAYARFPAPDTSCMFHALDNGCMFLLWVQCIICFFVIG